MHTHKNRLPHLRQAHAIIVDRLEKDYDNIIASKIDGEISYLVLDAIHDPVNDTIYNLSATSSLFFENLFFEKYT